MEKQLTEEKSHLEEEVGKLHKEGESLKSETTKLTGVHTKYRK